MNVITGVHRFLELVINLALPTTKSTQKLQPPAIPSASGERKANPDTSDDDDDWDFSLLENGCEESDQ